VLLTGPFGGLTDDVREFLDLPDPAQLGFVFVAWVELAGFARRFRVLVGHRWPSMLAAADQADWRQALWASALAPLAMLGALDVPARLVPELSLGPPGATRPGAAG
jgi:hypothetical protein